jgi:hypothetical protein
MTWKEKQSVWTDNENSVFFISLYTVLDEATQLFKIAPSLHLRISKTCQYITEIIELCTDETVTGIYYRLGEYLY